MEENSSGIASFQLLSEQEGHAETFFTWRKWKVEARERKYLELQRETELTEY